MENKEKLIKEYKGEVRPHEHSIDELIASLEQRFDIKKLEVVSYRPPYLEILHNQTVRCIVLIYSCLEIQELDFEVIEIIENEKSQDYYDESKKDYMGDRLILVFERNSKFIFSLTSSRLQSELLIQRAVVVK